MRGAEVARTARLSASAVLAALRVLAEHGLAERGPGGWCRGAVALADVSERDGWWSLDDAAEYNEMCRWPVILDDGVRAPPALTRAVEIA